MVLPAGRDSEGNHHTHVFTELGLWCEAPCPNAGEVWGRSHPGPPSTRYFISDTQGSTVLTQGHILGAAAGVGP